MKRSAGFSVVEIIIVVITLALLGGIGYLAYTNFVSKPADETAITTNKSTKAKDDASVNSSEDLDKVTSELNSTSLDDSDGSELDSATDDF